MIARYSTQRRCVGLWGINEGEPLGPAESLYLGDMYQLCPGAQARTISVEIAQDAYRTSEGSVTVLAELRWMAQDNDVVEVSVLLDVQGALSLLPLSPLRHDAHYTLIGIEPGQTRLRLSQLVYGCFCAGTRIMSGDGHLTPIEALSAGDYVLTRDNGAQPLLWVGKTTVRAVGLFAPVCLPAGYMGNLGPACRSRRCNGFSCISAGGPGRPMAAPRRLFRPPPCRW